MNKKILTAILISIALPGSMLSAPADSLRLKSYKLDEVVVTGTRNETDIRHLPMTISVVGRQQLEQTYQPSILPTLTEQVPGLFISCPGHYDFIKLVAFQPEAVGRCGQHTTRKGDTY